MLLLFQVKAQRPTLIPSTSGGNTSTNNSGNTTDIQSAEQKIEEEKPPLAVSSFIAENPTINIPIEDSTIYRFSHEFDPVRLFEYDKRNLGNTGTPVQDMVFDSQFRNGFDLGFHQFDIYKHRPESNLFYKTNRTYTDLFFSQGNEQDNFLIDGELTRKLGERSNLSIDYHRISHEGFYQNQKSRHTALAVNTWFKNKSKRYSGYITYIFNEIGQLDNGGISVDTLFKEELYDNRFNIPVNLASARTDHRESIFTYKHYYNFRKALPDSIKTPDLRRQYTLSHQFKYEDIRYKFTDADLDSDAGFYGNLQTDDRGLRQFIDGYSVHNSFEIATYRPREDGEQKDILTIGIRHAYHDFNQEPKDTTINNVSLTGNWDWSPYESLSLKTKAAISIWDQAGDYALQGDLIWSLKKLGRLKGHFLQQQYSPSLIQQNLYLSQIAAWQNNFDKVVETSLGGTYEIPEWKLSISGYSHLVNNFIYYDQQSIARQESVGLGILQLMGKKDFQFGNYFMENTFVFQQNTNQSVLRLPTFYGKHQVYFKGFLFKSKLLLKTGLSLRYHSTYKVNAYQPATGQFHLQDDLDTDLYPTLDAFIHFKVSKFRGHIRLDNLLNFLYDKPYYAAPYHPVADGAFRLDTIRFGIAWTFED